MRVRRVRRPRAGRDRGRPSTAGDGEVRRRLEEAVEAEPNPPSTAPRGAGTQSVTERASGRPAVDAPGPSAAQEARRARRPHVRAGLDAG